MNTSWATIISRTWLISLLVHIPPIYKISQLVHLHHGLLLLPILTIGKISEQWIKKCRLGRVNTDGQKDVRLDERRRKLITTALYCSITIATNCKIISWKEWQPFCLERFKYCQYILALLQIVQNCFYFLLWYFIHYTYFMHTNITNDNCSSNIYLLSENTYFIF